VALYGVNAITLMKHKHTYVIILKDTRMNDAIMIVIMQYCFCEYCDFFQVQQFTKCMSGRLRRTRGHQAADLPRTKLLIV